MRSRLKYPFTVCLMAWMFVAKAQQDPLYSMYLFDKVLINPGFTGSSNWMVGTLKYREQARTFEGHPVTQTFNFHAPLQRQHLGVGIKVINDRLPVQNTLNGALSVSYHLSFAGGKLSAGIEAGMIQRKTNYRGLIVTTPGDNVLPADDMLQMTPDLAAGLYFQKKQFYIGGSAMHLLPGTNGLSPVAAPRKHYYVLTGCVFEMSRDWTIEPSALVKQTGSGMPQFDANLIVYYDDKAGMGIQYRNNGVVAGMLRIEILRGLRLAYSYDYGITSKHAFGHGAHELILSYGVKLAPPPARKEIHPRYYF